ncbi:MAG TPA: glycosyltransferase family 9 protein [Chthoniobacterales bacterium]|nr:glycosyltransferase family 9 protein [Chthoniobacterales bacterium]
MNSILVIQLKRIGDVIATTPALRALRKLYPEAHITLLLEEHSAAIAPALATQINELWLYNRGASFNLWLNLVRRGFDLCLDFTGNDRSALITFLSKAARRLGYSDIAKRPARSWVYTGLVQSSVRDKHTVEHYTDLVRSLGDIVPDGGMTLELGCSVERSAETLRREIGVPGPYIVFHPGSARQEKFWLPDRWANVIQYAQHRLFLPCVITGGPAPGELRHTADIFSSLPRSSTVMNLAGRIDFLLSAAIIQHATCFVGVDTAAAHVAAAFERPELVLFGPTNPFHWRPMHSSAVIVRAGYPDPLDHFEPRQNGHPMRELSTETVIRGMETLFRYVKEH